jgi:signal transduction histidine kinase
VLREEGLLKAAARVLASGSKATVQWGPQRGCYFTATISPLLHQERIEGVLIVVRDATKEVQYQELRKEFVSNVSHELRTPLAVIKGFVETLTDGAMHDPIKGPQYLATVEKHINQLANLVADLLEISRLESRNGLPRQMPVNLAERISKLMDMMLPAAQKKSQTITANVPTYLPVIHGDADYIERAISNLLDNAVKYTPEGGRIEVSATLGDGKVVVTVSDDGIGIPPADLPRIFERFYRVDKSRSRDMGGTGLGLAIVKHVAAAHNGTVEVSSELGLGSTFRLILPTVPEASPSGGKISIAAAERAAPALAGN